ncbi:MAG: hypothetical protein ACD_3C00072G0003 [uncultured bacterium (gcode 4)]|uniref:Uncharacterized protein n=1 Tax=uncultured bacterium (gcode 4) TaxID=1234023 RepID=K2GXZ9_9BACT|nr:MAG: hypothetical protein ACD_3C00072G0003 [uncultured bacterium (gcode 4)]
MKETNYWIKIKWISKYIIVATHWAWDDINTDLLTEIVARKLWAFAIINNKFFKPTSPLRNVYPDYAEDFNRLPFLIWSNEYDWTRKKKEMNEFYCDLEECVIEAKQYSNCSKAIIIHIHWMRNDWNNWIDIWIWMNFKWRKVKSSSRLNLILWKETLSVKLANDMKDSLNRHLNSFWLFANIWENFNAQYKCFWIQYSKVIENDIFQLEICRELREEHNLDTVTGILGKVILEIF